MCGQVKAAQLELAAVGEGELRQYKADMQEAFQLGAQEGGFPTDGEAILPEGDIDASLRARGAIAYKAVLDGKMVGGAIVVIDGAAGTGHLDFLYVKRGMQGRGVGKFIWFEIEHLHPQVRLWETCTPYFERRNIHFYINVCGFHAVKFFSERHPNPNPPGDGCNGGNDGMFVFQKALPPLPTEL